jgi:hypothetical protein
MDRPVAAAVEIERKFVLPHAPLGPDEQPCERIQQGYLAVADDGARSGCGGATT